MVKRAMIGALLLLAACEGATLPGPDPADVYEYSLQTSPPLVLHWPVGRTVRLYVAAGASARAADLRSAVRLASSDWNRALLFGEVRVTETTDLGQADVVVRWAGEPSPVALSECQPLGVRAVTTFCGASEDPADGLYVFPRTDAGPSRVKMVVTLIPTLAPTAADVRQFVAHELGHVLGIARHSPNLDDLMWGGSQLLVSAPAPRDVATLRTLYQSEADIVP